MRICSLNTNNTGHKNRFIERISTLGDIMKKLFFGKSNINLILNNQNLKLPVHIAIIMDGNGRWAKKRGLPRSVGHREGSFVLKRIVLECSRLGIKYVSVFALSTENWSRPKDEIEGLMNLLREFIKSADKEIAENDIRIRFAMSRNGIPEDILAEIDRLVEKTKDIKGTQLIIALNYGGKDEIINAVKKLVADARDDLLQPEDINDRMFSDYLYLPDVPDPDMIIRPSGEKRLSNFFLWQAAYSEFWYSNVLWPDFSEKHLAQAIEDYNKRDRRFGGIKK